MEIYAMLIKETGKFLKDMDYKTIIFNSTRQANGYARDNNIKHDEYIVAYKNIENPFE